MIDLSLLATERLREQEGARFAVVGNVADFAALADLPRATPAAYVLPLSEMAEPSKMLTHSTQRHECAFAVLLIVRHAGDASGGKAAEELQTLRAAVQAAWVNWAPQPADCGPVQFRSGQLAEFVKGTTVWQDDFVVDRWVRRGDAP